jgi:hypothetical protein
MGVYDDTVGSFADEEGTITLPENVLELLAGAHATDVEAATAAGGESARADITSIIEQAVTAAVAGVKAEAFDALLETGTPEETDSGSDGSENDETSPEDVSIDDLFATN